MAEYPADRLYSANHLWVVVDGSRATIGITTFAADELGELIYIELPAVGAQLTQFDSFGTVESVKAVSELYAPVSGTVVEVNETLRERPELLNADPFGGAWIAKVHVTNGTELKGLLDADGYTSQVA